MGYIVILNHLGGFISNVALLVMLIIHTWMGVKVKGKVFYSQEPPSGQSTTTECGVNYQLLAVIY